MLCRCRKFAWLLVVMIVAVCVATAVFPLSVDAAEQATETTKETIPPCPNGHTPSDWQISIPPTETTQGQKYQYCLVCQQVIAISSVPPTQNSNSTTAESSPEEDRWVDELEPEVEREENIVTLPTDTKQEETKTHISNAQDSGCRSALTSVWALLALGIVAIGGCVKSKR